MTFFEASYHANSSSDRVSNRVSSAEQITHSGTGTGTGTGTGNTPASRPVRRVKDKEPDGFAQWYEAYPRHESRATAARAYERAVTAFMVRDEMVRDVAVLSLLEVTKLYADSDSGKSGSFTPLPATWLNGAKYFDDPACWVRTEPTNGKPARDLRGGPGQTYDPNAGKGDPNFGKL